MHQLNYFAAGQIIVEESTPVNYLHILVNGKCRVSPTSEEGKIALLDFVLPKDVIGDFEFFSKDQYYHNVTTILPCVILSIPVKFIKNEQRVPPIIFKELSEFFGITPRYFRNILAEFESEGILLREPNGVKLLDPDKLCKYTTKSSIN